MSLLEGYISNFTCARYYGGQKFLAVTILTFVNKFLETVTPLSILVILTINVNCLKLRYSKNPT
jgi:hypothetical protein